MKLCLNCCKIVSPKIEIKRFFENENQEKYNSKFSEILQEMEIFDSENDEENQENDENENLNNENNNQDSDSHKEGEEKIPT